jgi:hypothetical protein
MFAQFLAPNSHTGEPERKLLEDILYGAPGTPHPPPWTTAI